jgi:hypothetical protein
MQNYEKLAEARLTEVVGYFTTNPKTLVLQFSDFSTIFYAIYKKQPKHFTIGVTTLQEGPRKDFFPHNVAPGRPTGAAPVKFRPGSPEFGRGRVGRRSRAP